MICSSCRQRLFSRIPSFSRSNATLTTISAPTSTLPSHSNAITRQTRRQPYSSAPTAPTSHSSPSTTQPLTAPLSSSHPSPNTSSTPSADPETPNTPPPTPIPDLPISSVPGGEPLKGLAYLKNKPQILAMEDDQYPPWLWTILDDSKDGASSGVDEVGLEKVDLNGTFLSTPRVSNLNLRFLMSMGTRVLIRIL